ncbi:FAD:protein FMN transferase [Amycolatopsis sp. FDAARGOS 1241]|uniref:FAD:protein FMN transferase n=1 Tax=Amycolatopsis sp. FDAARGOS 1241 TaxID=2778070 RepID=UPI00194E3980|nr:FAD:protein FMN transferase [Amycolatopsis sp. FDAARGOS 1241]QRP44506.1 FAD:protein FMN transferase [Amycolatopsis sp. FDAARGOS 1241]
MTTLVEHVMGLPVSLDLRGEGDFAAAVADAFAWLHDVDARFSPFRADSEVCRLDRGELAARELSADLDEVLTLCAYYEDLSGGAFSARLPGRGLDPSGVVKGWAVQRAAERLHAAGARRFCLNAGGDVVTEGEPEPGRPWRVGVRHPERTDAVCAVLASRDGAVATSAAYERGAHVLDGRTGLPATGLLSVTIVAENLTHADALATAAFALGTDGIDWAAGQPGCDVLIVDAQRRVHRSPGLALA